MREHEGTFHVVPETEDVDGSPVKLVYVRADRKTEELDYRVHALQQAAATTARFSDDDPAEEILAAARKFYDFLKGEDSE